MRTAIIGLGTQGRKRMAVAGGDVVTTVDPRVATAQYSVIGQVPLDSYDAAMVCTPDSVKLETLAYLLSHGKHVLVEKPLLAAGDGHIGQLHEYARSTGATCYTAYNHRFEPHIRRLKELLDRRALGKVYLAKLFYGNGTALDVKNSPWRDSGLGVISDLGSHLLDLTWFMFGPTKSKFELWAANRFETASFDHVLFGATGELTLELEATFLAWRNTFTVDVLGELGSAHVNGLCKWGPSTFTVRKRVFPSGVPEEKVDTIECPDPTWAMEYEHFKGLCRSGSTNLETDEWIHSALSDIARATGERSVS
jgi:predicted dehydrogenase